MMKGGGVPFSYTWMGMKGETQGPGNDKVVEDSV